MGDRDPGKRKVPSYEASGESSEAASRRTRARGAAGPAGERGENPSLPLGTPDGRSRMLPPRQQPAAQQGGRAGQRTLDDRSRVWPRPQQQPAAQEGGRAGLRTLDDRSRMLPPQQQPAAQVGGRAGLRTLDLVSQLDGRAELRTLDLVSQLDGRMGSLQHQQSSGVRNRGIWGPPTQASTPSSSSHMTFAWDRTRQPWLYGTVPQLAAATASQPWLQAPSSSQSQSLMRQQLAIGPLSFPPTHTSGSVPHQGPSMRASSSGAQRRNTSGDGDRARGRGLSMQAPAPVAPSQPHLRASAGSLISCPRCYNNSQGVQCLLCGREPANFGIDHHGGQPPLPPQQGQTHLPAAVTNQGVLAGQQLSGHAFRPWKPRASVLVEQEQQSANASQQDILQVGEHERCPGCRDRPGRFVATPMHHFCLCVPCHEAHVVCPWCALSQRRLRQDHRQG